MRRKFQLPEACPTPDPVFTANRPWLAPLAGYSDLPFRLLCREYGATICETEMVSAKGLLHQSPGSDDLLKSTPEDQPLVVQLFGHEPAVMAEALLLLRRHGYRLFDCNMGCPVRKVMRQGAGAALLADERDCLAVARAMLAAASQNGDGLPLQPAQVGFKLRLPPSGKSGAAAVLGRALEDLGATWITLHARTASMGYAGSADWQEIALLAKAVAIPVIASGDLMSAAAGARCLAETGASAVMYGRGALRNPFIFRQHAAALKADSPPEPGAQDLVALVRRHIGLTRLYCGDSRAFAKIRSILPRYVRNAAGVNRLRLKLCQCADWDELGLTLQQFLEQS